MGKKNAFLKKKNAQRYRLIPQSYTEQEKPTEKFTPTAEHLKLQHECGIFFDDDYDYTQHLRDRNEKSVLLPVEEVETIIMRAPSYSNLSDAETYAKRRVVFDDEVDRVLEEEIEGEGDLDDNFVELAGGAIEEKALRHRELLNMDSDASDGEDLFNRGYEDYDEEDDEDIETDESKEQKEDRDVDLAFNSLLESNYNEDQIGDMEGEDIEQGRGLEPEDIKARRLTGQKRANPGYDEKAAKEDVRRRMEHMFADDSSEDEIVVETEVSARKRLKWDCESFVTQYSNIYNHPCLIKETNSRAKLMRMEEEELAKQKKKEEEAQQERETTEEEEDSMDEGSVVTWTGGKRPPQETADEKKARKAFVKEQRRTRRVEKKMNQEAFGAEQRQAIRSKAGKIRTVPIV